MTTNLQKLAPAIRDMVQGLPLESGRYHVQLVITGPLTEDEAVTMLFENVRTVQRAASACGMPLVTTFYQD